MSNHAWIEENKCMRDCGPYCSTSFPACKFDVVDQSL